MESLGLDQTDSPSSFQDTSSPDTDQLESAGGDPFADRLVEYSPGEGAGYGQDSIPDVVLGAPEGAGNASGSTDVLSLGRQGSIVLALEDFGLVDEEGPDLLIFENPFVGWVETGYVAVSEDGQNWHEWPCDPLDAEGEYPGCAGVEPVYASSQNELDPTDPDEAGGDAFDLADLGIARAVYVRIRDSGENSYSEPSGGFDLDALAVVHGEAL